MEQLVIVGVIFALVGVAVAAWIFYRGCTENKRKACRYIKKQVAKWFLVPPRSLKLVTEATTINALAKSARGGPSRYRYVYGWTSITAAFYTEDNESHLLRTALIHRKWQFRTPVLVIFDVYTGGWQFGVFGPDLPRNFGERPSGVPACFLGVTEPDALTLV